MLHLHTAAQIVPVLLLLFLLFLLCYAVLNTIRSAQKMPGRVVEYRRSRREREGNRAET